MAQLYELEGQEYSFPDDATEEQIFNYLRTQLPTEEAPAIPSPEPAPEAPLPPPEPAEGFLDRTGELIAQGARQFAGSTAGGISAGLEYFDVAPETQDELDLYSEEQAAAAAQVAPIKALQEAEGIGDVVSSAYEYLAQSSPHMAAMMSGAWAGGKAATKLTALVPTVGWGIPARAVAIFSGGLLGGAVATFNSFFGMNVEEAERVKGRALTAQELEGASYAAFGQSIADTVISKIFHLRGSPSKLRNTLKRFIVGAGVEGSTEVFQDTLEILQANDWDVNALTTPEARYRLTEAGLAGMSIGGPLAGVTGPFTTAKPPPIEEPPPLEDPDPEPLALPAPTYTTTGENAEAIIDRDPEELVEQVAAMWPSTEELPSAEGIEIEEKPGRGYRLVAPGNRVLTPFFRFLTHAQRAEAHFREKLPEIAARMGEEKVNRAADVALEERSAEERVRLQGVARETATPVQDFTEEEIYAGFGGEANPKAPSRVEKLMKALEKLPHPRGIRDELTWDDILESNVLTPTEVGNFLTLKKPLMSEEIIQPDDILRIAEEQNIYTKPKRALIRIGKQKKRKSVTVPDDASFKLFAKRLTGRDDLYKMTTTQRQVLAQALRSINQGTPFKDPTRIPIADRPAFTESQLQRAAQALRTSDLFVEEMVEVKKKPPKKAPKKVKKEEKKVEKKRQLKPVTNKQVKEVIRDAVQLLDSRDIDKIFNELVHRRALVPKGKNKSILARKIQISETTGGVERATRAIVELDPTGEYRTIGSLAENVQIRRDMIPDYDQMEDRLRTRLEKRGLRGVELRIEETLGKHPKTQQRKRGVFTNKNGNLLIMLALDVITDEDMRTGKAEERLAYVLDHESIHALKEIGVISERDITQLTNAIETQQAWNWDTDSISDVTYWDAAYKKYFDLYNGNIAWIQEEAVADMFRDYVLGKVKLTPPVRSIWQKIVAFFREVKLSARDQGVVAAAELFERIEGVEPRTGEPSPGVEERYGGQDFEFTKSDVDERYDVAPRSQVPAVISTNVQLAAITHYFNRNQRRLQLIGGRADRWKIDRIIPEGQKIAVRTDYRVQAPLNEGILDNTPPEVAPMTGETFAMQGVHLLDEKSGNPNLSDVAAYDTSVTLNNVEFKVDQTSRADIVKGLPTDTPPGLSLGEVVQGQDSTDGVPIIFNPFRHHLYVRIDNGLAVKGADQVTLVNGRAYARGNIEYWSQDEAPAVEEATSVVYQDGVAEYARPSLELEGPDYEVSLFSTLYDSKFKGEPKGTKTIWQIITRLQRRAMRAWGEPLDALSGENMETIARILSAELNGALKQSGNAAEWYAEDIQKMFSVLSLDGGTYTELRDDPEKRFAFSVALAITSVSTRPTPNMRNALTVYDSYKETGVFPEDMGFGKTGRTMRRQFRAMNQLVRELGMDQTMRFFNTKFTKAQLMKMGLPGAKLGGVTVKSSVYGSYFLGPKLGSFFQNLTGNFDTVTMDKWFVRMWNRITGQFISEADLAEKATAFLDTNWRSADRFGVDISRRGDTPTDAISAAVSLSNAIDRDWKKLSEIPGRSKQRMHTQAHSFQKHVSGDEVPGARKRAFMDQTVRRTLEILGDYNINVQPASMQAIVWYPEQDLYQTKLGSKPDPTTGERSYGGAAELVMREKGYDAQVTAQLQSLDRRRAEPTRRNVGDRAFRSIEELQRNALEGRDRTRFLRYHTAVAFRKSLGPRFGVAKPPRPYTSKGAKTFEFVLADGTTTEKPVEAIHTPIVTAVNHLKPAGIAIPPFIELKYGDAEAVSFFVDRIMSARASTDFADAVTVYPQNEYAQKRLFITEDGEAGFAMDEGDIQSVFKTYGSDHQQVSFSQLALATHLGGRRLDAFDTVLPELFSFAGFEVASRLPFNAEAAAADGIDITAFQKAFADFQDGRPDVVFMAFDPNNYELYRGVTPEVREEETVDSYEEAVEAQDIAIDTLRQGLNDGLAMDELYDLEDLPTPQRAAFADANDYWLRRPRSEGPGMMASPIPEDKAEDVRIKYKEALAGLSATERVTKRLSLPSLEWGKLLWLNLDKRGELTYAPVDVRKGFNVKTYPSDDWTGWGQRHIHGKHTIHFNDHTPFQNPTIALQSFLDAFAEDLPPSFEERQQFYNNMVDPHNVSGPFWAERQVIRGSERVLYKWRDPTFISKKEGEFLKEGEPYEIRFTMRPYKNTDIGRMAFTLLTGYPQSYPKDAQARRKRQQEEVKRAKEGKETRNEQGKRILAALEGDEGAERLVNPEASLRSIDEAERVATLSPEKQKKIVNEAVNPTTGEVTLPKRKKLTRDWVPPEKYMVDEGPLPSQVDMRIRQMAFENDVLSGEITEDTPGVDPGEVRAILADYGRRKPRQRVGPMGAAVSSGEGIIAFDEVDDAEVREAYGKELASIEREEDERYDVAPDANALLEFIRANPDGFTVSVDGKTVPASGFSFAPVKAAEIVVSPDQLNADVVERLLDNIDRVQKITAWDVNAGGWLDPESGDYFLDASVVFDDEAQALYAASASDQKAIFNLGTFNDIRTDEGIAALQEAGVYSPESHADARAKARTLASRFEGERDHRPSEPELYDIEDYLAPEGSYDSLRGHGMQLTLDQQPDRATLIIQSGPERIEVRGHPAVGAYYEGSRLDRIINSIPKQVNISALFAGETRDLPAEWAEPIIDALEWEDEIQRRLATSKEREELYEKYDVRDEDEQRAFQESRQRNVIAEDLRTPKYRKRIVRSRRGYTRKEKHRRPPTERYDLSPEQERIMRQNAGAPTKQSFAERLLRQAHLFGGGPVTRGANNFPQFGQWFRKAVFDRFDPIRRADIRAFKKLGMELRDITADVGAWAAFRMLKRSIGVFQTTLTRGIPVYRNGMFATAPIPETATRPDGRPLTIKGEPVKDGKLALMHIFEPMIANPDTGRPETMREGHSYFIARRAARLIQEGRQRLMTTEDIITQLSLADTIPQIVSRFNSPDVTDAYVAQVLDKTVPMKADRAQFGAGRRVDFQEIFDNYQVWNQGHVQLMLDTGVINQEMADIWINTADYIPYYRQMSTGAANYDNVEDMFLLYNNVRPPERLVGEHEVWTITVQTFNPDGTKSIMQTPEVFETQDEAARYASKLKDLNADNAVIKVTKSAAPVLDLLETVTQNSLAAIQTSMANVAMQRATRNLRVLGEATEETEKSRWGNENIVRFRVNGKEVAFNIHDPAMYMSMTALTDRHGPILKLFGMPANLLRNMVTRTPGFMAANMARDTLSAWALSGKNGLPVFNTAKGFVDAIRGSTSAKALAAAGVWAGHDFQDDPTDAATALRDEYIKIHPTLAQSLAYKNPMTAIYNKLGKWSAASDAATRIAVYERVMEETGNEAQAVFEAVEVLNFSARGSSRAVQIATAVIPFLNARLQGLDLFYRASGIGAEGFTADPDSDRVRRRFLWRMGTIVTLSALYWAAVHDEEEWQEQEAHMKDNYWILPASVIGGYNGPTIMFPIPFEVGLLGKVIPERVMAYFMGQETSRDLTDALLRGMKSTLEINWLPQAVLPFYEASINHSYFTGRPIEPTRMEDTDPGYRYNTRTSELAISIGEALNDYQHVLPTEFISPMRIDHMIKGYGGTLGTYVLELADWAWRTMGSSPDRPTIPMFEYPVIRRFIGREHGRGIVTQAYQLMDTVEKIGNTLRELEEAPGKEVEALEYAQKHRQELGVAASLTPIKEELAELRKERKRVFDNPLQSGDHKRMALDIITMMEQKAVQDIPALRRWAFD